MLLVRSGSEHKVAQAGRCTLVAGDIADAGAVQSAIAGANAVIYNIGILREHPRKGITFERLQYRGAVRVIEAARRAGIQQAMAVTVRENRATARMSWSSIRKGTELMK